MAEPAEQISPPRRFNRTFIPFATDAGVAPRGAIGLIVLGSDHTVEHEFRSLLNIDGVGVFHSRIKNSSTITPETLLAMGARIPDCVDVFADGIHLDVVAYGCTSASMVIGEDRVFELIHGIRPDVKCTTPITAAFRAFEAFDARRLAVLTPYNQDVNDQVAAYIESQGFTVTAFGSFNEEDDNTAAKITTDSIKAAAIELGTRDDVDCVFVSCTSLRVAPIVSAVEEITGKPVTSSNHAMAWHALRLCEVQDNISGAGSLFERF